MPRHDATSRTAEATPTKAEIRAYWDARAFEHEGAATATTNDVHLRELEFRTLRDALTRLDLGRGAKILDVGCGDGRLLRRLARERRDLRFLGLDYSPAMIAAAQHALDARPVPAESIRFVIGDVTMLDRADVEAAYDLVISDRCLINLPTAAEQARALRCIAAHLAPGGHAILVENFDEGQTALNDARTAVGLPAIPRRWHNLFFTEDGLRRMVEPALSIVKILDFSSAYYHATRVVYAKLCQLRGEEPDYDHPIHRLAVDLAWHGRFSPIRLVIAVRSSEPNARGASETHA